MAYELRITRSAEKDIAQLHPRVRRQVLAKILLLENNPRPQDVGPLRGEENAYRVDSGEYRILFHLDDEAEVVTIFRVRHRRDVYRNL